MKKLLLFSLILIGLMSCQKEKSYLQVMSLEDGKIMIVQSSSDILDKEANIKIFNKVKKGDIVIIERWVNYSDFQEKISFYGMYINDSIIPKEYFSEEFSFYYIKAVVL